MALRSRVMDKAKVKQMAHAHMPSFLRQRAHVELLDKWHKNKQENSIFIPSDTDVTSEYHELVQKSPTPWAATVVTAVVQNAEYIGPRIPGVDKPAFASWQRNRMDARQAALYRASCAHGLSFVWGQQARDPLTSGPMTKFKTISGLRMAAFYDDDDEEWPRMAMLCDPLMSTDFAAIQEGWYVKVIDETATHFLTCKGDGLSLEDWTWISHEEHSALVTPVVRYAPNLDIDGNATSDFAPLLPLLARIDQDTFDRLIVQRFGAWKVRWIAGLAKPKNQTEAEAQKIRLRVESILIGEDADTKFGTLDGTDLDGFIKARDADLRDLSATSQTPPHHMLGLSSNLQAESLAAAEAGLQRKSREHRIAWGESHEQLYRLDGQLRGDRAAAEAYEMESRWRDTESRSMEQAAMSLGMLATNLKVPVEMLWERIPNWTDQDVERAKQLVQEGGIDELLAAIEKAATEDQNRVPVNA